MLSSEQLGNLSDRDLLAEARVYEGKLMSDPAKLNLTAADATAVKNFNAGKKVYYLLRWLSKSGMRGEWSETIEATING